MTLNLFLKVQVTVSIHFLILQIQSLIMCLHPLTPPTSPSRTPSPHPYTSTQSMYKSALSSDSFIQSDPSIQDSIYLSFYEGLPHQKISLLSESKPHPLSKQKSCDPRVARERYQRRLQAAMEEIVSVNFSIDSVFLSLSSNGEVKSSYKLFIIPFFAPTFRIPLVSL